MSGFSRWLYILVIAVLGLTSDLVAREGSHRVLVETDPFPLVAGYASHFKVRVDDILTSVDPLLGSEAPTSSRLTAEIRSGDGSLLVSDPVLVSAESGSAGTFGLSYVFDSPGGYLLGLGIHDLDGVTEWHPVNVRVVQDPYAWVNTLFAVLVAAAFLGVLPAAWKKAVPTRKKRIRAVALGVVLVTLLGVLLQQYLAPLVRRSLLGTTPAGVAWNVTYTPLGETDEAARAADIVKLEAPGCCSGEARFFPAMQSGRPATLAVSFRNEDGRQPTGLLAGSLLLESQQSRFGMPDLTAPQDPITGHEHHAMAPQAGSGTLQLSFRQPQPGGPYEATVLPVQDGSYKLALHFQAPSTHLMLDGSRSVTVAADPDAHAGHSVAPASDQIGGMTFAWAALGLAFLGVGTLALLLRRKWSDANWGYDLFLWRPLYRFVRSRYFQPILWTPNLIVFSIVIYLGIWDVPVGGRNLATKLTWTIWWAIIIFAFVFAGKIWCAMCPFGALTTWTTRAFNPKGKLPAVLRNIWIANIAFLFVTWADDFWGIVATPRLTSLLVIIVAIAAIAIGFFFERATFCRNLCPIGGLIGIYSMFSGLELRAKDREICRTCTGKECYAGTPALPGCPMTQFPSSMDRNNYCNLCGDCVKACPHENLALQIRPFARDIWKSSRRHVDEAFLAIALVGLTVVVTGHMVEPWHGWMDRVAAWVPWTRLGVEDHAMIEKWTFTLVYTAAVLGIAPLLLLAASAWGSVATKKRIAVGPAFRTYAYMFIPVGIALHLAHNLLHLLKEGSGIVPVFKRTVAKYTPLNVGVPNWNPPPLASDAVIYWLQMAILTIFYIASIYLGYRIALKSCPDRNTALRMVAPMVVLSLGFTLLNVFLLSQPMAARHHH